MWNKREFERFHPEGLDAEMVMRSLRFQERMDDDDIVILATRVKFGWRPDADVYQEESGDYSQARLARLAVEFSGNIYKYPDKNIQRIVERHVALDFYRYPNAGKALINSRVERFQEKEFGTVAKNH